MIRSYQKGSDAITFAEGTTQLQVTGKWNGRAVGSNLPIERSNFLPGQRFSQRFAAIVVDKDSLEVGRGTFRPIGHSTGPLGREFDNEKQAYGNIPVGEVRTHFPSFRGVLFRQKP